MEAKRIRILEELHYISLEYNVFSVIFDDITYEDDVLCSELKRRNQDFKDLCDIYNLNKMYNEVGLYKIVKRYVKERHYLMVSNNMLV